MSVDIDRSDNKGMLKSLTTYASDEFHGCIRIPSTGTRAQENFDGSDNLEIARTGRVVAACQQGHLFSTEHHGCGDGRNARCLKTSSSYHILIPGCL